MDTYFEEIRVTNTLENKDQIGTVEVQVQLCLPAITEGMFLWARLEDRKGEEMDAIFPLPLEEELSFCMNISDPVLWNAENAWGYRVILEIRKEEEVIAEAKRWIAFYRWEILDGDVCLNGKKVPFRKRMLPAKIQSGNVKDMNEFLCDMKRHFCNTLLIRGEQRCEELEQRCIEYGIYLIVPGEHLEYGMISAELEKHPEGDLYTENPDYFIHVVKDGALIENKCVFSNTSQYQLLFEVEQEGIVLQKGKLHVDIPAGESKYLNLPYMELHQCGEFHYKVSLALEKGYGWEKEGYAVASGGTQISNFYME